jgi:hypothetical protein
MKKRYILAFRRYQHAKFGDDTDSSGWSSFFEFYIFDSYSKVAAEACLLEKQPENYKDIFMAVETE